jgi:hypothetical protein
MTSTRQAFTADRLIGLFIGPPALVKLIFDTVLTCSSSFSYSNSQFQGQFPSKITNIRQKEPIVYK